MDPITLCLPPDLADDLAEEADELGYSSRSEYVHHLLRSRSGTDPNTVSIPDRHRTEYATADAVDELRERVADGWNNAPDRSPLGRPSPRPCSSTASRPMSRRQKLGGH